MPAESGHYYFNHGISALFEMPTSDARKLLPRHLQPLEVQHERSVLSVTAFDFYKGDGGVYEELVLAILVPPLVKAGERLPKAALYPFIVGTSTELGRKEGIDRWKLPHLMRDIDVKFREGDGSLTAEVSADGEPILDLTVTSHDFEETSILYHSFVSDADGNFKSDLLMKGDGYCEHEFERGSLTVYAHEMTEGLTIDEIADVPFREQWMRKGIEIFHELEAV